MKTPSKTSKPTTYTDFLNSECDIPSFDGTWLEWFESILVAVMLDGQGFSGKRPNCDSGWESYLKLGLSRIDPTIVKRWGEVDEEYGYAFPVEIDHKRFTKVVLDVVSFALKA